MDRLDDLEAQSIFIFREAFARLKRVALLWSLGKDSNVMIWIARKAFFGRIPFPVLHVDTGKKFPEMYAFRDRYAVEWNLDLKIEPLPSDRVDRSDIASGRSFRRTQDRGTKAGACQIRVRRPHCRNPSRRGADACQGTGVFAPRT